MRSTYCIRVNYTAAWVDISMSGVLIGRSCLGSRVWLADDCNICSVRLRQGQWVANGVFLGIYPELPPKVHCPDDDKTCGPSWWHSVWVSVELDIRWNGSGGKVRGRYALWHLCVPTNEIPISHLCHLYVFWLASILLFNHSPFQVPDIPTYFLKFQLSKMCSTSTPLLHLLITHGGGILLYLHLAMVSVL